MSSEYESIIIGGSGLLGSSLLSSGRFDLSVSSGDSIRPIRAKTLVIAAPSATKWLANLDPEGDFEKVKKLMNRLSEIEAERVVLLSTVDVYANPEDSSEESPTVSELPRSYGSNRLALEKFVLDSFEDARSLRLSGLVGPGLKKNPIFDLGKSNNLENLNANSKMQFLPTYKVVEAVLSDWIYNISGSINLTAEPVTLQEAADRRNIILKATKVQVSYDVYSSRLVQGVERAYFCSKFESLKAIGSYFDAHP